MEKLTWFFEIIDKVSKPAKAMQNALKGIQGSLAKMSGPVGKGLQRVLGAVGGGVANLGKTLGVTGVKIGAMALSLGSVVAVGLGVAGAKFALESIAMKENALIAFETILKSKEAAKRVMANAIAFAGATPFDTAGVIANYQRLLVAGFSEAEVSVVLAGAGDLGAAFGTEKTDQVIGAFQKIMAQGKLTGESMMMLGDAGVNIGQVYERLGKTYGTTAVGAQKLISAGKIASREGVAAALGVIKDTISGGELGGMMAKQSQSLSGLWSSLTSRPFELVTAANSDRAIGPLKRMMATVTNLLDPASPTGKRLLSFFEKLSAQVGDFFNKYGTDENIEKAINAVVDAFERAHVAITQIAAGFGLTFAGVPDSLNPLSAKLGEVNGVVSASTVNWKEFGAALGHVANAITAIVDGATKLGNLFANDGPVNRTIFALVDSGMNEDARLAAAQRAIDIGTAAGQGMQLGLEAQRGVVRQAGVDMADEAITGAQASLRIESPSKVFFDLGAYTGQGFNLGLASEDIAGAMNDNAAPPSIGSGAFAGGGGARIDIGGIQVTVHVQGAAASDPAAVGSAVASAVETRLMATLDRLFAQAG